MNRKSESTDVLPACELLSSFGPEDRRILTSYGTFKKYTRGQTVIQEGQPQDSLHFLVQGTLGVVHETRGTPAPVGEIEHGEWFGEINIFDPHSATATVIAHTDTTVWRIARAGLEQFLNNYHALGCGLLLGIAEVLARRARRMVAELNATWDLNC